jgi:hypothetical protein
MVVYFAKMQTGYYDAPQFYRPFSWRIKSDRMRLSAYGALSLLLFEKFERWWKHSASGLDCLPFSNYLAHERETDPRVTQGSNQGKSFVCNKSLGGGIAKCLQKRAEPALSFAEGTAPGKARL